MRRFLFGLWMVCGRVRSFAWERYIKTEGLADGSMPLLTLACF
jgi:hypothetical protein